MRISDLQKLLADVKADHGDLEILETRFSDYGPMDIEDFSVVRAARVIGAAGEWVRRIDGTDTPGEWFFHYNGN